MNARRLLPFAALATLAALLYAPWNPAPLSILDFSEFLPLLEKSGSFAAGWAALIDYFREHGRSAWLTYGFIAANYAAFGTESAGWELLRFAIMLANSLVAYALLRRLGIGRAAALLAAALLVTATGAAGAWLRLTGEMLAMLAFLCAAHLALGYQDAAHWRRRAVAIALLMGTAVLAKETSAALVPLFVLFALVPHDPARRPWPVPNRRGAWVVALTFLVVLPIALLVAATARAGASGYIDSYGTGHWTAGRALGSLLYFGLPLRSVGGVLDLLAALVFIAIVVWGWRLRFRRVETRASAGLELSFILLFALAGMTVYMPWPRIEAFYLYPFLLGPVLLFAVALHELRRAGAGRETWAIVAGVLLLALSLPPTFNAAQRQHALRRLNFRIAAHLAKLPPSDTLVVAVPGHAPQPWQGHGPTLRRFALATGAREPLPLVFDRLCPAVNEVLRRTPRAATVFSHHGRCGPLPGAQVTLEESYYSFDPIGVRLVKLPMRADFLLDEP